MDDRMPRVTGKQVLNDAVILVKDTGTFIFDLGRLVVFKIKRLISDNREKKEKAASPAENGIVTA